MATSRLAGLLLVLAGAPAWSREAASTSECQAAAAKPPIAAALAAASQSPVDLKAQFALADAWSDAGCFNDAVSVLQNAMSTHADSPELQTRLRVAKSLVGEQHFFDDLDRADLQAKSKRAVFRCENLADLEACGEALRVKPDDPAVLTAQGDALMRAQRPSEALQSYRQAETLSTNRSALLEKIRAAEAQLPLSAATPARTPAAPRTAALARAPARTRSVARRPAAATAPATSGGEATPSEVRMARVGAESAPTRRYSNAAPPGQSH